MTKAKRTAVDEQVAERQKNPRYRRIHSLFDAATGRGLEVGPLADPLVTRGEGDIRYVDVRDRAGLIAEYTSHVGIAVDRIVEPDYVLLSADGRVRPMPEAVAEGLPFDWVVASHVIEHVPDVITWLQEVAEVLVDGGTLLLVIPDRRFTFDVDRPPTTVGEMLLAQQSGDTRPSVRAVYDHYSRCMHINTAHVWAGGAPGPRMYDPAFAMEHAARARAGEYVDCHVWIWSPGSFVEQLTELADLGLCDFAVEHMLGTARGEIEFYVRLRRLPRNIDSDERKRLQHDGIREWSDEQRVLGGGFADNDAAVAASMSPVEARIIRAKRKALHGARTVLSRAPGRGGSSGASG